MNNQKIVNLSEPTHNEDVANQKYVDEKTETINLFTFLSKYANKSLFIKTFIKEKATYGYHTNHNSNRAIFHQNKFCAAAFDQSGLNNHATQNRNISLRSKISTSINNGRHFFLFGQNRYFDLPFLTDPFILSIISVVKINKQSTRGRTI